MLSSHRRNQWGGDAPRLRAAISLRIPDKSPLVSESLIIDDKLYYNAQGLKLTRKGIRYLLQEALWLANDPSHHRDRKNSS